MIFLYMLAAFAALVVYAVTARIGAAKRAVIALLVFLVPSLGVTALVFVVGDRPRPDAVNVEFEDEPTHEPAQAECERLMRTYESSTEDQEVLKRLDAECPGWESMR